MVHSPSGIFLFHYNVWLVFRQEIEKQVCNLYMDRKYFELFKTLVNDKSVPIMATNIVYIIKANNPDQVNRKLFSRFSTNSQKGQRNTGFFMLTGLMNRIHLSTG